MMMPFLSLPRRTSRIRAFLAVASIFVPFGTLPRAGAAVITAGPALPDFGQQWSAVGSPGNRPVNTYENLNDPPNRDIGSVNYEYRIAKTEVTNAQYLEFVRVYAPFHMETRPDQGPSRAFVGHEIDNAVGDPFDGGNYYITGNPNAPATMAWEFAARYANWLHNGKQTDRAAFESGVYDTSTFTFNPDGTGNTQLTRSPGASVWIPSVDEWVKAASWDPNKVNPDGSVGGYWRFLGSRQTPLPAGRPENGGLTNRGLGVPFGPGGPDSVGSYPNVVSPWGLLDTSGGVSEYTESTNSPGLNRGRIVMGSAFRYGGATIPHNDGGFNLAFADTTALLGGGGNGLRLASFVPTPGGGVALGFGAWFIVGSRRRGHALSRSATPAAVRGGNGVGGPDGRQPGRDHA